jgi:uncharacterized membrane protein
MIDVQAWWISSFAENTGGAKLIVSCFLLSVFAYFFARQASLRGASERQVQLRSVWMDLSKVVMILCSIILVYLYINGQS